MAVYAGLPCCSCQALWLPIIDALLLGRYGIRVRWVQLIGGYVKSGGTHGGGGASDAVIADPGSRSVAAAYAIVVLVCRHMGADASWHRPEDWDNADGIEHVHACLRGCTHGTPHYGWQINAVDQGGNGLGLGGMAARDDGPRPLAGRTWQQGIRWAQAQTQKEFLMALTDKQQDDVYRWLKEVVVDSRKIEPRTERLSRLLPGKEGVGNAGDLWPLIRTALARDDAGDLDTDDLAKAIAEAIPPTLAKSVADELAKRLEA